LRRRAARAARAARVELVGLDVRPRRPELRGYGEYHGGDIPGEKPPRTRCTWCGVALGWNASHPEGAGCESPDAWGNRGFW
jgi:hypothetical protein